MGKGCSAGAARSEFVDFEPLMSGRVSLVMQGNVQVEVELLAGAGEQAKTCKMPKMRQGLHDEVLSVIISSELSRPAHQLGENREKISRSVAVCWCVGPSGLGLTDDASGRRVCVWLWKVSWVTLILQRAPPSWCRWPQSIKQIDVQLLDFSEAIVSSCS